MIITRTLNNNQDPKHIRIKFNDKVKNIKALFIFFTYHCKLK